MDNFFDNKRILDLIWKRKFHFILVAVIAVVLSAIFSGPTFITPKYKSTARIYPSNVWPLSNESETEQMIEILNSDDIKHKMFDAFELDTVYKIHKNDPLYYTYMFDLYNTNVGISKTEFETAEIKVLDEDPQRASNMCDSIIVFYNKKVRELHKAKDMEMVQIAEKQIKKKKDDIENLATQLDSIRRQSGIINLEEQIPEITRGYMSALATGRGSASDTKTIKKLYDSFADGGTHTELLERQFELAVNRLDSFSIVRDHYMAEYEKDITYSHVVQYPFPADKKAFPVRWLIVVLSTFSALFVAMLAFMVLDYKKEA